MAQIPFSPPQVQAALQNPTRFPDQKLQQYAQRGSPTGQVSPMMAQQEMASRGQERQAFQRQQAMQNNPENSPTIFQQKDAELAQARAALQQQQQQVGMLGAMLAKKQQDLQARERGIAALPMRQDMFTAMDGGIVFRGGGQVQRFNGRDSSDVKDYPDIEKLPTEQRNALMDYGREIEARILREARARREENKKTPSTTNASVSTTGESNRPSTGAASRAPTASSDYGSRFVRMMAPYTGESEESTQLSADIQSSIRREIDAINRSQMSEEDKAAARKKVIEDMQKEYGEYTKGRESRRGDIAEALRGKPADMWQGIAAGLPTDTRGLRIAGLLSGVAKGVAGERGRAEDREREARMFLAKAAEEDARADLAERRGQRKEADAAELRAQQLRNEAADRMRATEKTGREGLAALLSRSDKQADIQRSIGAKAAEMTLGFDADIAKLREQARLRPQDAYTTALQWLAGDDPKKKQAAEMLLGRGRGTLSDVNLAPLFQKEKEKWESNVENMGKPYPYSFEQFKARFGGNEAAPQMDLSGWGTPRLKG